MPMAKIARHIVTTPSVPPMTPLTSAGSSDSTTAPTSQNQDTITMPSHSSGSAYSVFKRRTVEVQGLAVMARSGADGFVIGIRAANAHDNIDRPTTAAQIQPM